MLVARNVFFAAVVTATAVLAQSPLCTLFVANNGGGVGGAVYLNLTVGGTALTAGALDVHALGTGGAVGTLDVYLIPGGTYVGNEAIAGPWGTPVASGDVTTEPAGTPTFVPLDTSFTLNASTTYAVAIVANGWQHAYFNGNGTPGIPGSGTNQTYANLDLTLRAGSANNVALASNPFDPRVANVCIHYVLGSGPVDLAYKEPYGAGCDVPVAFCEDFAPTTNDLGGVLNTSINSIRLTPVNGGYHVSAGSNGWNDQSGPRPPGALPGSLPLVSGDDVMTHIDLSIAAPGFDLVAVPGTCGAPLTDLYVCSNGFVSWDPDALPDFSPVCAELFSGPSRWAPLWADLAPNAQGSVHFDYDSSSASCYVTWHNVPCWGVGGPGNTFQLALLPGGVVEYRWENLVLSSCASTVGFSTGNVITPPAPSDISVDVPFDTVFGVAAPQLDADERPVANTTINMITSNLVPGTTFGAVLFNLFADVPGTPFFLAPHCNTHIAMVPSPFSLTIPAWFIGPGTNCEQALPLLVPNLPGLDLYCQAVVFTPGISFSNGLKLHIGNL